MTPRSYSQQGSHRALDIVRIERTQDLAIGIDALIDLQAQLARDQGLEAADEAIGERPGSAAKLEDVTETLGRDQADPGDLALEQRIRRRRRPVHDGADLGKRRAGLGERIENAKGLVLDGRRHLGDTNFAALLVEQDEVGEGAADIDADDLHAPRNARWTSSCRASSVIAPV